MKRGFKLILFLLIAVFAVGAAGCRRKTPDSEFDLEVYCVELGYGSKWCEDMLALFKEQSWVKEKYPLLNILPVKRNELSTFAASQIEAGARHNTIDLLFSTMEAKYAGKDSDGKETLLNLTDTVYNKPVPGEDVLFKDKIIPSYLNSFQYIDTNDIDASIADPQYYFAPWAGGMNGILYNVDLFEQMQIDVPNTTDELLAVCQKIKGLKGTTLYSFIQSDNGYFEYLFPIFWAQYQSIEGYEDFYNGITPKGQSKDIFEQTGRLKALQVIEELVKFGNGYLNPSSPTYNFSAAQTLFLSGEGGVMHVNGDWFDNEMAKIKQDLKDRGVDFTVKMMKTPIISSLVDQLDSLKDKPNKDKVLSGIVAAIDAGESSYENVSQEDFDRVAEARSVVNSIGPAHLGVIPNYSNAKEVAADFLRFMATDIAQESYMQSTSGASLPFANKVKQNNEQLYNTLSPMQKDRLDYFNDPVYPAYTLRMPNSFPLVMYGGLSVFTKSSFYSTLSAEKNTKHAQDFFDETKVYWNDGRWQEALRKAGL